ncbi:MAG: hypothetical protein MJH09_05430 [Cetobacterium sp.]|nr:hypothetical protein [Cetobacterium sp.]
MSAKGHAYLNGREAVMPEDIKAVVYDVLRHRIILTYEAEAEEKTIEDVINEILNSVTLP